MTGSPSPENDKKENEPMEWLQALASALLTLKEAGKAVVSLGSALVFLVAVAKFNGDKVPLVALFVLSPIFIALGYLLATAFGGEAPVAFPEQTSKYVRFWVPVLVHVLMIYFLIISSVVVLSMITGFPLEDLKIHNPQ